MNHKMLAILLGLFMAFSVFAQVNLYADTLQLNSLNSNLMKSMTVRFNGANQTESVGAYKGTLNGKASYFFCYDLRHSITVPNTYTATLLNPTASSFPSNLQLPSSFNIQVATSMVNSMNFSTFTKADQFAGLQLAIWTVLYDWSASVTPNLITTNCSTGFCVPGASSTLIANANSYLAVARSFANSFPNGQSLGNWVLISSMNGSHINQVLVGVGPGVGVPEPQTYFLLGCMLALSCYAIKFKKAMDPAS